MEFILILVLAKRQINPQEAVKALNHVVSESDVQSSPFILFLNKISEVKVDIPIFDEIPKLNGTAKKIA